MAYREVAEPKKPGSPQPCGDDLERQKFILTVYIVLIVGIMVLLSNIFYRMGAESVWEEAVRRGVAERVEWPEGLGDFKWKEAK